MQSGFIKKFDHLKGFGFIETEEGDDIYFSIRDIHPKSRGIPVREGMPVKFDIKREIKGDRAVNIRLIEK